MAATTSRAFGRSTGKRHIHSEMPHGHLKELARMGKDLPDMGLRETETMCRLGSML